MMEKAFLEELKQFPNQPAIVSILNGPNKGKQHLMSDSKSIIVIENSVDPFIFAAGELNEKTSLELEEICPNDSLLYCNPKYHDLFLKNGWQPSLRLQLYYSSYIIKPISCGNFIRPIDNIDFFKQCLDYKSMSDRFGSAENFLKFGLGYALCNNKEIIAEIYSAYSGENEIDISIVTHPNYRHQGYGAQIASYFAEQLIGSDIMPVWSSATLQ